MQSHPIFRQRPIRQRPIRQSPIRRISIIVYTLVAAFSLFAIPNASFAQWRNKLPSQARQSILWFADHEEANMDDWVFNKFQYAGGGIFNTGGKEVEAVASNDVAHSGRFAAKTTITNAFRAENGNRAVRLMRWTDRPWDDGGDHFPASAYYSTWLYMPEVYNPNKYAPWDPGDGGWWNIFQFKSDDANGVSQPIWSLNVSHHDSTNQMELYLYSNYNTPSSRSQPNPIMLPARRWVHLEALYQVSAANKGRIAIWQNGRLILDQRNVVTIASAANPHAIWGIGNYTNHISGGPVEGTATIYFDDSAVSTRRLSRFTMQARP